jgi:multidrug efflux pump subunit AcrB
VTVADVSRSLVEATSSSRFVVPVFWADPKTGIGYCVQVQVPPHEMSSATDVGMVSIRSRTDKPLLVRDVADVSTGTLPGEYDRYNMKRVLSLTANIEGEDLGRVLGHVHRAIAAAGPPPRGARVDVRGQAEPMRQIFGALGGGRLLEGLTIGLALSILVIFLLLTAYFQSLRLALASISTVPAVLAGASVLLLVTGTTLNIQSFVGVIMAIGVATANAILLTTFAERIRRQGHEAPAAAVEAAQRRLRPLIMTSFAMIAGMLPLALGLGEGGEQTAPLGRAVGGLLASMTAKLFILPPVFAVLMGRSSTQSASLDPHDPQSPHFMPETQHELPA